MLLHILKHGLGRYNEPLSKERVRVVDEVNYTSLVKSRLNMIENPAWSLVFIPNSDPDL